MGRYIATIWESPRVDYHLELVSGTVEFDARDNRAACEHLVGVLRDFPDVSRVDLRREVAVRFDLRAAHERIRQGSAG